MDGMSKRIQKGTDKLGSKRVWWISVTNERSMIVNEEDKNKRERS